MHTATSGTSGDQLSSEELTLTGEVMEKFMDDIILEIFLFFGTAVLNGTDSDTASEVSQSRDTQLS